MAIIVGIYLLIWVSILMAVILNLAKVNRKLEIHHMEDISIEELKERMQREPLHLQVVEKDEQI